MTTFNLSKLLTDVFAPRAGERVTVMVDLPHRDLADHPDWQERRRMAEEWRTGFAGLGAEVLPLLSFPATGANNADLPDTPELAEAIAQSQVLVAMTEYSATAPLSRFAAERDDLRVASMPQVLRRMEQSALAADYREVARKAHLLKNFLNRAEGAAIRFTTGHEVYIDLRYREAEADDGMLPPGKEGFPLINLPSGEAFSVPYEGERDKEPSQTAGIIPVAFDGETVEFHLGENRIFNVTGPARAAEMMEAFFAQDRARRNVAELGLGCNDRAVVKGNVLEDEKAGLHWAYGRSEHLGGTVGPDTFSAPENVVHQDIVYAAESPIGIAALSMVYPGGEKEIIMQDSEYTVF